MYRIGLFGVLREALPQPLVEEVYLHLSLIEKISPHINSLGSNDISMQDILDLIENNLEEYQTLPAYIVSHLVSLYRESTEFKRLEAQVMDPNVQMNLELWRVYTYVAFPEQLARIPEEQLTRLSLQVHAEEPTKLQMDLRLALRHIRLLNAERDTMEYAIQVGAIITALHHIRETHKFCRYNVSGVHLRYPISSENLSYIDFSGTTFCSDAFGVNLNYCNLQYAHVHHYTLTMAMLSGANLCNADFYKSVILDIDFNIPPGITVLALRYIAKPISQNAILNRLDNFYETFGKNSLSQLGFVQSVIAVELVEAITTDEALSNETKLEMLTAFLEHPLIKGKSSSKSTLYRLMERALSINVSNQERIVMRAIDSITERLDSDSSQSLSR